MYDHTGVKQTKQLLIDNPYKNVEHALRTLYTQFAFVLHSFCALVNHILHMCKMCATSKILGTCAKCAQEVYIAICVQFAHNPQDMCKICVVCAQSSRYVQCAHIIKKKKKKKKSSAPVIGHPSKYWAGSMFEYRCFQCGMVSDTYSYSRRPFICAATLPKVSVLIVCNGNSSMSWVKRSGSFKYNQLAHHE